jgi:superfamily II DNA/RNA helicase
LFAYLRSRRLVIDEADTMFDQGFGEDVTKLLGILRNKQPPVQVRAAAPAGGDSAGPALVSC